MPADRDDIADLHAELTRYRTLTDAAFEGLCIHKDGFITTANAAFCAIFGYSHDEIIGIHISAGAAPESRELMLERFRSGSEEPYEGLGIRKDGSRFPVQLRARNAIVGGHPVRVVGIRDLSAPRAMGVALERVTESIIALDLNFRLTFANHAACELFQQPASNLLGGCLWTMYPSLDGTAFQATLRNALVSQRSTSLELNPPNSNRIYSVRLFPSPDGMTIYTRDVTDARHLEHQLRDAQRLEGVGRLAGGVAHDFNNLMTVILGHCELLRRQAPPNSDTAAQLSELAHAATRATEITQQLLAFGRRQVLQPVVVDLNALVRAGDSTLRRLIREDIELRVFLDAALATIEVDPTHLEQVLVNLVANARDAMPQGGQITIETANVRLDEAYTAQHAHVRPGPYVLLSITDTGTGMDRATTDRIFEPFFTTKELGRGTGLGLATVQGIVTQSHGHVWVYSELGRGTTFKVYFPASSDEAAVPPAHPTSPAPRGHETLLLVEDDDAVRKLLARVLTRAGYRVLAAPNGPEALALWASDGPADLLLTDVVMPKMNGRELARSLVAQAPDLRVIYMSGYTENVIIHGVLDNGVVFMQKPVTIETLLTTVRSTLDRPTAPCC